MIEQNLDDRTTVDAVIKDLPLYKQLLKRGQNLSALMQGDLIEIIRRQQKELDRLGAAEFREVEAHGDTIDQRDRAEDMADKLAAAIAERFRVEVGEHSNMNCPWAVALEVMNGEFLTDSDQDRELDSLRKRIALAIELTPAELTSGFSRVLWAQGLIVQLPEDHEGRNSWLMNFGNVKS